MYAQPHASSCFDHQLSRILVLAHICAVYIYILRCTCVPMYGMHRVTRMCSSAVASGPGPGQISEWFIWYCGPSAWLCCLTVSHANSRTSGSVLPCSVLPCRQRATCRMHSCSMIKSGSEAGLTPFNGEARPSGSVCRGCMLRPPASSMYVLHPKSCTYPPRSRHFLMHGWTTQVSCLEPWARH